MNEIGRELNAHELRPGTVVVIFPPNKVPVTMWVNDVDLMRGLVTFHSAVLNWTVLNFVTPEGKIQDDKGRTIRVHQFLEVV